MARDPASVPRLSLAVLRAVVLRASVRVLAGELRGFVLAVGAAAPRVPRVRPGRLLISEIFGAGPLGFAGVPDLVLAVEAPPVRLLLVVAVAALRDVRLVAAAAVGIRLRLVVAPEAEKPLLLADAGVGDLDMVEVTVRFWL